MDPLPKRNWWGRNWKWLVPTGCLSLVLACAGFFVFVFALAFGIIKSSDAYTEPLALAKGDEQVKALLGEPIQAGYWVNGNIEDSGATGKADLAIPISGPKGSATLYVVATKKAGKWEYSTLEVAPKSSGPRIDLNAKRGP